MRYFVLMLTTYADEWWKTARREHRWSGLAIWVELLRDRKAARLWRERHKARAKKDAEAANREKSARWLRWQQEQREAALNNPYANPYLHSAKYLAGMSGAQQAGVQASQQGYAQSALQNHGNSPLNGVHQSGLSQAAALAMLRRQLG